MKISQIILETSTTAGVVATVAKPLGEVQQRTPVNGLEPISKIMKGTAKKKGPYANSLSEGAVKQYTADLKELTDEEFKKKYNKTKQEARKAMKEKPNQVDEAKLEEDDIILVPGQGRLKKTGFVKHDPDKAEHEGQTLKNSLHTIIRLATHLDKELTVRDNFPEWVSEKVGSIKGDMLSVMNYIISSQEMRHDTDAMEGSENKYSNLSNRGVNRGINRAADDFDRMMDLDQAESPHYKTQHQQDTKQRLKTKPMAGPKGVLPEGSQRVDSIVTDALKVMKGPEVSDAVLALKRVLGDRAYNERRGFYSFYIDQIHDMYGQQGLAEGLHPMVIADIEKLATLNPADRYSAYGNIRSYFKADPALSKMASDLMGGYYEADMLRSKYKTAEAKAKYAELEPMHQAFIKQAMGQGQGVAEGEIDTSRMNKQHQDFYNKNPNFKRDDREATSVGGRLATKVTPKTAQVTKKPMTPFEGKIDFAKKLQGKVDKHNKAVVKTKQAVGSRVADIGAGGKEHNVKTDAAWDAAKKKVAESYKKK